MSPEHFGGHTRVETKPNAGSFIYVVERDERGIDLEGLGSMLRHRRVILDLTMTDAAKQAFISPAYMRRVENAIPNSRTETLTQPRPEILQNWVRVLKWSDEPHTIVVFEMAGYRVTNPRESTARGPRDPEQEELLAKVGDLFQAASQTPHTWRETRNSLEPYLDFLRSRIIGKGSEISPSKPERSTINIETLPNLLTVNETAELLRVTPLTLKRWGKTEKLTPIRINTRGDRRYRREDIIKLLSTPS